MVQLRRTAANAAAYDMECELVSPERAQELWPVMQVDDLLGALWLPGDGKVNPTDLTQSLAKGARQGGARSSERVRVTGFDVGRAAAVTGGRRPTQGDGRVRGGRQLRRPVGEGARRPGRRHRAAALAPSTSTSSPRRSTGTHPDLPIMRDPDGWTYFKEEVGGLVVGGFEPEAKPWRSPDDLPHPFEFQLLEEDWEHFSVLMDEAVQRDPGAGRDRDPEVLQRPGVVHARQPVPARARRPSSTTSSSAPASTRSASPPPAAPGGRWPSGSSRASRRRDLVGVDVRRFAPFHGDNALAAGPGRRGPRPALRRAVAEPRARVTARDVRQLAACTTGWPPPGRSSAPRWAGSGRTSSRRRPAPRSTTPGASRPGCRGRPPSSARPARRSRSSTRRRSRSTSSPGRDALEALQWVCAADVDVPVGHCVYTPLLNERGTYEADLTVTRDRRRTRSCWSRARRPRCATSTGCAGTAASTRGDVTDGVRRARRDGPALARPARRGSPTTTGRRTASRSRPAGRSSLAGVPLRATRMTYVGELGWELTVPVARRGGGVRRAVRRGRGPRRRPTPATTRSSRCGWRRATAPSARELTPDYTPVEAGLVFATALKGDKPSSAARRSRRTATGWPRAAAAAAGLVRRRGPRPDALGRRAAAARRRARPARSPAPPGARPSAPRVGLGLPALRRPGHRESLAAGRFEVDVAGERFAVRLSLKAPLP